jgi:hypothetical protein
MSHFALVDENNIVVQVIVAEQDFIDNYATTPADCEWVQTSYNTAGGVHYSPETGEPDGGVALRKNFAGIGYTYDSVRDAFYSEQPLPSWILNEDSFVWEAPVAYPDDGKNYYWDEDTLAWVEWEEAVEAPE